jgi:hypothetical protein
MSTSKNKRDLFEQDRRTELKMRIALKRLHGEMPARTLPLDWVGRAEIVGRLIDESAGCGAGGCGRRRQLRQAFLGGGGRAPAHRHSAGQHSGGAADRALRRRLRAAGGLGLDLPLRVLGGSSCVLVATPG